MAAPKVKGSRRENGWIVNTAFPEETGFFERLLLASGNRHKYGEFLEITPRWMTKELLFAPQAASDKIYETNGAVGAILSTPTPNVEEDSETYAGNALRKALAWSEASGLPCVADDSGLEVRALGWAPGVRSARVTDKGRLLASDGQRNMWLLSRMEGQSDRRASFVAAVALSVPGKWALVCAGVCDGRLAVEERGEQGFGYDPLFIPEGHDVSFGEMPSSVKNQVSHRAKAMGALADILRTQ
jgi:XTP/dITP diphosphohydrolase